MSQQRILERAPQPREARRPLRPMPRQRREAPSAQRERAGRRTIFGRPWPLPVSPVATLLVLALAVAAGVAWYFEGRYETPPAEAAKQFAPFKASDVDRVTLTTAAGSVTFTRDENGQFGTGKPAAEPTPIPGPEAPVETVSLSPATKVESLINQLHDLHIGRVIANEPSKSSEYGLDQPKLTVTLYPQRGQPATLAVGALNPDSTSYYARREARNDTVLVSRYTLDELIKLAEELAKEQK